MLGAAAGTAVQADDTEGWLFVGRRSAEGWRPSSPALVSPRYPVRAGQRLVVGRDALVYGSVDCKRADAADFKPAETPAQPVLRIKADRAALEVVGAPLECPSAGHARTVWAKVRIPGERLLSQER